MKSAFRKISRVGSLTGGTKWYLSEDCLLAAKRTMYAVEYRRFYLRDLECVMVWPRPSWLWRLIVPAVLLAALGASLWLWADSITGAIFVILAFAWAGLELALGPTAQSRIRTTGANVDLPLVKRMRGAQKILARIDAAVHGARGGIEQTNASIASPAEPQLQTRSEAAAIAPVAAVQANGS